MVGSIHYARTSHGGDHVAGRLLSSGTAPRLRATQSVMQCTPPRICITYLMDYLGTHALAAVTA
jgi:hypothetical protein